MWLLSRKRRFACLHARMHACMCGRRPRRCAIAWLRVGKPPPLGRLAPCPRTPRRRTICRASSGGCSSCRFGTCSTSWRCAPAARLVPASLCKPARPAGRGCASVAGPRPRAAAACSRHMARTLHTAPACRGSPGAPRRGPHRRAQPRAQQRRGRAERAARGAAGGGRRDAARRTRHRRRRRRRAGQGARPGMPARGVCRLFIVQGCPHAGAHCLRHRHASRLRARHCAAAHASHCARLRPSPPPPSTAQQDVQECLLDLREHDVPYHVRFAIDTGVRAGHWFEVKAEDGRISLKHRLGAARGPRRGARLRASASGAAPHGVLPAAGACSPLPACPAPPLGPVIARRPAPPPTRTHRCPPRPPQGGPQEARRAGDLRV